MTESNIKDDKREEANIEDALASIREQLDAIDTELVDLLNKRIKMSLEVASIKRNASVQNANGTDENANVTQIYYPQREQQIIARLTEHIEKEQLLLLPAHLRAIYNEIFSSSRAMQEPVKIAYLGPQGTYSHLCAIEIFGTLNDLVPTQNFTEIFQAVHNKTVNFGVIPIENSLHGSVISNLDLFLQYPLHIHGEKHLRISHTLASTHTDISQIKTVYSHPQALGQCQKWLNKHLPQAQLIAAESTAQAAHLCQTKSHSAAIANDIVAQQLQLNILSTHIMDDVNNITKFLIIADTPPTSGTNSFVLFTLTNKIGTLAQILQLLQDHQVNLNKLESRPLPHSQWEYAFFADLEINLYQPQYQDLLQQLQAHCGTFRNLGSFTPDKL